MNDIPVIVEVSVGTRQAAFNLSELMSVEPDHDTPPECLVYLSFRDEPLRCNSYCEVIAAIEYAIKTRIRGV